MSEIDLDFASGRGKLSVGGLDISHMVTDVQIAAVVRRRPQVIITIEPLKLRAHSEDAEVELDEAAVCLITSLGWTAPEGQG